ncbi:MAG: phosphoenolpyruvate--protein phosphotransferase [Kiritimatiellaceae bacterium]|nr:phosphoenolpyruvate--protein phosphotransferase [Kiritimatiellaceae bacterium]
MSEITTSSPGELVLRGVGVSPGVVIGEVVVFAQEGAAVPERVIGEQDVPLEIARFEEALIKTRHQISGIQRKVAEALGEKHASIFDAHLLVVDDRYFVEEVIRELREQHRNVEAVLRKVADRYIEMLSRVDDDYLRERVADVRDVTRRISTNLAGERMNRMDQLERPCIAVARDFSPSDTASINRNIVHALVTDLGSATSHTAIMARALEVPAVVGLRDISAQISSGETVLVDGSKGLVIVRPTSERLLAYAQKAEEHKLILCELETLKDKPSETKDGYYVPIAANIELPAEISGISKHGAKGIGLFRTEFLFLNEDGIPDEDEQTRVYSEAADQCAPDNVVIRTLDLGGDKFSSSVKTAHEMNPFLGFRAIRFCLANPAFFKVQLRAILRAAAGRNISMMYPMVCCLSEVIQANGILEECRQELKKAGIPCAEKLPVGVMIEIPSAALTADLIAPHVDFFSIGTNDLIQYTLAVDRVNENVSHLYMPTHISILKLIRRTVMAGHAHRIPVAVCGQMAAAPELVPLLIGLGVDELSISPPSVPMIKDVIRNLHYSECRTLAKEALQAGDCDDVIAKCRALLQKTSPEILELIS